jgi:alcohol dehydrogenase (cytochrome c)
MAPLVVRDMVIVGSSGAEYGVRGHIDAFDLATGQRRWRRYVVPKPGEPGGESWQGDAWARGGGAAWITGSYDPQLDLVYWSTANPSPDFDGSVRPGDNLYTNSVLALRPADGSIAWHYQFTPHDVWDYDGISENILFEQDGRKLLAHFDKNGHLFILDRTDGRFVRALRFFPRETTWGDVDPQTGKVTVKLTPTPQGVDICPGPAGGKEWPHGAYSPQTGLLYTPVVDVCGFFKQMPQEFKESMAYWGGDAVVKPEHVAGGALRAFDPHTGREAWTWRGKFPMVASLLATAGGLLFTGQPSGEFGAWDAKTGKLLWEFQTGSGIHSNPITYSVKGKQYVAVPSGWGGWMKGFAPETFGHQRGTALFVFALP